MIKSSDLVTLSFPESSEAWDELSRLSREGIPLQVAGLDAMNPVEVCLLMDFFLHDPSVAGPVEPFSSLLSAMVEKKDVSLWDVLPPEALPNCAPETPAQNRSGREHCGYFPYCLGYGDATGSCDTWQAVFARLEAAARERSMGTSH